MPSPPNDQYGIMGSRLGFRLGYLPAALRADRETHGIFRLDDQPVKVRRGTTTIHDVINDTPNTCALTVDAATPPRVNQRLTVKINANKPRLLFAGPIQTVGLSFELQPHQTVYPCQAIDDTPLANRKLPYGQFVNTSGTIVGQWLVANFCPADFSSAAVQANLPPISVNFDATEGMDGCLRQVAKLIGGYFYWEDKVLHLFTDETTELPDPIDDLHPFLLDPPISVSTDTSQVRTRVYGKGYAEEIIADVAANDPILPISNAVMFNPAGGQAVSETQRLRYTGTAGGGGGTVVGPGIGPSSAPNLALQIGTGITPGLHYYAVTFQTAAGESLISPFPSILVGLVPPPSTGPAVALAAGGPGPDVGGHYYAATFVTPAGETLIGAATFYAQGQINAGTTAVVLVDYNDGAGYGFAGLHVGDVIVWSYTYSTADPATVPPFGAYGETPFGPASAGYTMKQAPGRPAGSMMNVQFQILNSADPNVKSIHVWMSINGQPRFYVRWLGPTSGFPNQPGAGWRYGDLGASVLMDPATPAPTVFNPILGGVALSAIPIGPTGTTARNLYRTLKDVPTWGLLGSLANNTATTFGDTKPDSALGAPPPTVGTALAARVNITAIPIGAAGVTARNLYRTAADQLQLKLMAILSDNTTTTFLDFIPDANLGTNAPTADTSGLKQPDGVVLAGATSIVVAGTGWARPGGGGWAIIGNGQQTIRYTGISGNTLTGIPATGPGAITATVSFNSTITGAAALLGVTGLLRALIKGAPINLWVQRDDLAAQASLAAVDHTDGIIEHLITDERRGETSLTQICDADLEQYSQPLQTVPYATHDTKTKSGKPVTFNLASPAIHVTLTIQEVTITEIDMYPRTNPRFTAVASSVRFSLEDILRRLGASLDVTS